MLTGFYITNREKDEEDHEYWERISKLPAYYWMFRREECVYCNDATAPGCCLIFTYEKR